MHEHAGHSHGREQNRRRLSLALALVLFYMLAELIGGLYSGSLALLADAGHMLSDAASLGLALFALWLADRPSPTGHTWGYYRTEILAALINGATLVAISILIFYEAYRRILEPPDVAGGIVILVALGGLFVNLFGLWILHGGRNESLNIQGAWLHVLTDTLGSIQTVVAGALIWWFDWHWVDPLASFFIGLLVVYSSWGLLKESVAVLMESAPGGIDVDEVRRELLEVEGAEEVHDLHVWTITSGMVALSAHVRCPRSCDRDALLSRLRHRLEDSFQISHITLQIESERFEDCRVEDEHGGA